MPVISEIPLSLTSIWGISSASRVFIALSPFVSIPKSISAFKKASSGMLTSGGGSNTSHLVHNKVSASRKNNTLRNAFTTVEARIQQLTSIHGTNQVFCRTLMVRLHPFIALMIRLVKRVNQHLRKSMF